MKKNNISYFEQWKKLNSKVEKVRREHKKSLSRPREIPDFLLEADDKHYSENDDELLTGMLIW